MNYADILRADYVSNALRNLPRFDLLRKVSRQQMTERMTALGAAVGLLDGPGSKVADTRRWLVVFRIIEQWSTFSLDHFVPVLVSSGLRASEHAMRKRAGGGILLGFVRDAGAGQPTGLIDRLRATVSGVDFIVWDGINGASALI